MANATTGGGAKAALAPLLRSSVAIANLLGARSALLRLARLADPVSYAVQAPLARVVGRRGGVYSRS